MKRKLTVLGSTGSIGQSTLKVVEAHSDLFKVVALIGGTNTDLLIKQIQKFQPRYAGTRDEEGAEKLRKAAGSDLEVGFGESFAEKVSSLPEIDTVVSAIVGSAGLKPTLAAASAGKTIALANKESLVVAGKLVRDRAEKNGARIIPVDSEHSAIFQCLAGSPMKTVRKLILTASGGPFFLKPEIDLKQVRKEEALKHPNWDMGAKITIDSATMMNKGLELIEAHWLFDVPSTQLDVIVHPESIVHSMVEFQDGSILAQLGVPDMCGPIAYALSYPERLENVVEFLDWTELSQLRFHAPDHVRFPAIQLARKCMDSGPTFPAVLNGANEETVKAFLEDHIAFLDIVRINEEVVSSYSEKANESLEDYVEADVWGRMQARERIERS